MARTELLQKLWKRYENEHDHVPSGTRAVVEWAVKEGLLELPRVDPLDALASQMSKALREETAVYKDGRTYRVNHAWKITKNGVQATFWGIMGFAPWEHLQNSFAQRREMVVSDLVSLRNDVDVCNDMYPHKPQTQLELGFHEDVEERLLINSGRIKTASNAQKQPTSQFHDAVPV
jgi:hypothetical protein